MDSTKRISIDQLTVGMFIAGLDQPWYRTPFLLHKWLVTNPDDIVQLKRHGIHVVTIDTKRGLDVGAAPAPESSAAVVEEQASPAPAEPTTPQSNEPPSPAAAAAAVYRQAMEAVERVFLDIEAGQPPKIVALKPVVRDLLKQIIEQPEAMMIQFCLDKMRRFDGTLANHGMDVCVLTLILAVENKCTEDEMEALGLEIVEVDAGPAMRLGGNVDDAGWCRRDQAVAKPLSEDEIRHVVQGKRALEALRADLTREEEGAGIVDEDVDAREIRKQLRGEALNLPYVGEVGTVEGDLRFRRGRVQAGDRRRPADMVVTDNGKPPPQPCQRPRALKADPRRAAGDDRRPLLGGCDFAWKRGGHG